MKFLVNIARIITGCLFIFSGLVKAIDPRGLAYKMQEFFEAWANAGFMKSTMHTLNDAALPFSLIMITLEVAVGLALLLGFKSKWTTWILFLLMLFFTFLTSYVLFSGKIKACGCFGDCIPLTPMQTFAKDIVLLLFALLLVLKYRLIKPIIKTFTVSLILLAGIGLTIFLQWYVLRHLPVKDCLPFKEGNNILELRKMPANAIADMYEYDFTYAKDGVNKDFGVNELPDSSWTFVDRKQVLVKAGSNNIPLINDFSFTDSTGDDVTESILNSGKPFYLLFVKDVPDNINGWKSSLQNLQKARPGIPVYIITASRAPIEKMIASENIIVDGVLTADGTAIKTAARANPTMMEMEGAVIKKKVSWADIDHLY